MKYSKYQPGRTFLLVELELLVYWLADGVRVRDVLYSKECRDGMLRLSLGLVRTVQVAFHGRIRLQEYTTL